MTAKDVQSALQKGNPSIVANVATINGGTKVLSVGVVLLRPDQVDIVARRVKEILQHAI
jgi:L-seryl-tRNA(Ser) seleniumtransferase